MVVTTGFYHTCGVTTAGETYCWGGNGQGEVGTGDVSASEPSPEFVMDLDPGSP
jgi:alpha-tubulin suppressor-like RCC1 family protein